MVQRNNIQIINKMYF